MTSQHHRGHLKALIRLVLCHNCLQRGKGVQLPGTARSVREVARRRDDGMHDTKLSSLASPPGDMLRPSCGTTTHQHTVTANDTSVYMNTITISP